MKYFITILVVIISFQAFVMWPVRTSPSYALYEMMSQEQIKEYKKLLKKHGLHKQISVIICEGSEKYYFNKKGQKCRFI